LWRIYAFGKSPDVSEMKNNFHSRLRGMTFPVEADSRLRGMTFPVEAGFPLARE
jgi:hypothetical protein